MDNRSFDPRILGSITTGTLLVGSFGDVHEAIEHIVGHPVWTHEIPGLFETARAAVLKHYPDMPATEPTDFRECAEDLVKRYGDALPMPKGTATRDKSPLATLQDAVAGRNGAHGHG
ncbi:hypothetical protein [Ancylobacter polymorphus]|uniref:DUF7736 domain-containing protein n=1 Tax=Ancylobacter polymorphus TaxID=223390 RepID=A0ABU0BIP2_9HYPH|nr:hypothetical protein [Ancylobacter polymorphus]MDQ0305290.1 hypothetical protein [Ancylobacter polymorphus]